MKLLLDTHALLWWLSDDGQLGQHARDLIAEPANEILVSVASLWEIQVKLRVGKLSADMHGILDEMRAQAFELLPIHPAHLLRLATLPAHHKDPFDHLLIAQAITENATFMSEDRNTPKYDVLFITCSNAAPYAPGR